MGNTLFMRAASLSVSAALLALAVLAAFSVSYTVQRWFTPENAQTITVFTPEPPAPPPPEPVIRRDPLPPTMEDDFALDPMPQIFDPTAHAVETSSVFTAGPVTISDPRWIERPRDLARYYPRRAIGRDVEGSVVLDCLVSTQGRLTCDVLSETPANFGFGEAALRIAADHRMAPATRDGAAVEGRYRMRVPFELD